MKSNISFTAILRYLIVLSLFIVAALTYFQLPQTVPVHWNFNGVVDGTGDKSFAAWLIPGISLLMLILFPLLSRIDPKRESYELFKSTWSSIQTIIIGVMGYIYFVQLYFTLNQDKGGLMAQFMFAGLGIMLILLGNLLGKVRQNYFVGFKTPWSLNDPEVWQKSQRVAGWMMVISGVIFLIEAILNIESVFVFILMIILVVIVPTIYSYVISKKKNS